MPSEHYSLHYLHRKLDRSYEVYQGIRDASGVIGDAVYLGRVGWWWNYSDNYQTKLPKTLDDILRCLSKREQVEAWFKEFPLNFIVCERRCIVRMVRFYQEVTTSDLEEGIVDDEGDQVSDTAKVDSHLHGFRVIRNNDNILKSRVIYLDKSKLYINEPLSEIEDNLDNTRLVGWEGEDYYEDGGWKCCLM